MDQLSDLDVQLIPPDTEVEFYFLGGAVIFQAFASRPATAHISQMFHPADTVREALRAVADAGEEMPADWVHGSVKRILTSDPRAYVELERVRVFAPLPEYVLAVKCAAMRLGEDFKELDDVRYVLRAMNVTTADDALSIASRYFTERQLPEDIRAQLEDLFAA